MIALRTLAALVATVTALTLSACGGGGESSPPPEQPPLQLLIYGNRITTQMPLPDIGWARNTGMAASDLDHSYAVQVAVGYHHEPLFIQNFEQLETDPARAIREIPAWTSAISDQTVVVLQFGDIAPGTGASAEFTSSFNALVSTASHGRTLVCVSTWIEDQGKDAMMRAACEANGGRWVYIGDIYPHRVDVIPVGENPAIARMPHDPSMAEIARRVLMKI